MKKLKQIITAHPLIFSLLGLAVVIDLTGVIPGGSLGSLLGIAYFLGLSSLLRFVIVKKRIYLALSWVIICLLYVGWIAIHNAIFYGDFHVSLLFILLLFSAFKTMRYTDSPVPSKEREHNPEEH